MTTIEKFTDLNARIDAAIHDLRNELFKAMVKHPTMHSAHEGHSVIREELEELWEHVRADTGRTPDARKEAMQVAAMGLRYALDLCEPKPVEREQDTFGGPRPRRTNPLT
jgi:hypothetical protein